MFASGAYFCLSYIKLVTVCHVSFRFFFYRSSRTQKYAECICGFIKHNLDLLFLPVTVSRAMRLMTKLDTLQAQEFEEILCADFILWNLCRKG